MITDRSKRLSGDLVHFQTVSIVQSIFSSLAGLFHKKSSKHYVQTVLKCLCSGLFFFLCCCCFLPTWTAIALIFPNTPYFRSHGRVITHCLCSLTAAATLISGAGAPALPPEWVLGMPHSSSGPHSNRPREALLGKQRAVTVPLPHPPSLRRPVDAPPAAQGAEAQPAQANPVGAGPGPTPNRCLGARGRTASHVPSLLDADVEGQSRDCTLPLCRMKSRCSRPSIYELEKEFLS